MNNKIIGIALILVGVGLVAWGYNIYDSASSQVTQALGGEIPTEALVGMIGGAVCLIIGILKLK